MKKIALISTVHLWVNPRLVKEADALAEVGFEVVVVTLLRDAWSLEKDRLLHKNKKWKWVAVNLIRSQSPFRWLLSALREHLFAGVVRVARTPKTAAEAYTRGYPYLRRAALAEKAGFYIAHTQGGLAAAAEAAAKNQVCFGFDCEDLNAISLVEGLHRPDVRRNIECLEEAYLPKAAYVTATSIPMADYLKKRYNLEDVKVIHNAHSVRELENVLPPDQRPKSSGLSLAWMSATIGRGRGLETALEAIADLPEIKLTVFGRFLDRAWESQLKASKAAQEGRVQFLPIPEVGQIMPALALHDIGLAIDDLSCPNLATTICNKFFLYAQAGLVLVATGIPGQRSLWPDHNALGMMIEPGNAGALKKFLSELLAQPERVLACKQASWRMGQTVWNWDHDKKTFLGLVRSANP